jgi:hypothetical protein
MTSEEINNANVEVEETCKVDMFDICYWLKEIAYQLAVMNERDEKNQPGKSIAVSICATTDDIPVRIMS